MAMSETDQTDGKTGFHTYEFNKNEAGSHHMFI